MTETQTEREPLRFVDEDSDDSPELREYKKLVRDIALSTKRRERWCNDGFEEAMEKLGIKTIPQSAVIKVVTSHPFEFEVRVAPDEYSGLSWEEQRDKALAEINSSLAKGPFKMSIPAESVEEMTVDENEEEVRPHLQDYYWYQPNSTAKAHAFLRGDVDIDFAGGGGITSRCGTLYTSRDSVRLGHFTMPLDPRLVCRNCDR